MAVVSPVHAMFNEIFVGSSFAEDYNLNTIFNPVPECIFKDIIILGPSPQKESFGPRNDCFYVGDGNHQARSSANALRRNKCFDQFSDAVSKIKIFRQIAIKWLHVQKKTKDFRWRAAGIFPDRKENPCNRISSGVYIPLSSDTFQENERALGVDKRLFGHIGGFFGGICGLCCSLIGLNQKTKLEDRNENQQRGENRKPSSVFGNRYINRATPEELFWGTLLFGLCSLGICGLILYFGAKQ